MNKRSKLWKKFFIDTYLDTDSNKAGKTLVKDASDFGLLMDHIASHQKAHSVLWKLDKPVGTEDRTWCRVYYALLKYPGYAIEMTDMDYPHVSHILQCFSKSQVFWNIRDKRIDQGL